MVRFFALIIILILSVSCSTVVKTTSVSQKAFVFISDDNIKERAYLLIKESRKDLILYTYKDTLDTNKNIEFSYFPKTNILNFGTNSFEEIIASEFVIDTISGFEFKKYRAKNSTTDATSPIFFNQEYGVLAIGNVLAPTIVFLPNNYDLNDAKVICKLTFE